VSQPWSGLAGSPSGERRARNERADQLIAKASIVARARAMAVVPAPTLLVLVQGLGRVLFQGSQYNGWYNRREMESGPLTDRYEHESGNLWRLPWVSADQLQPVATQFPDLSLSDEARALVARSPWMAVVQLMVPDGYSLEGRRHASRMIRQGLTNRYPLCGVMSERRYLLVFGLADRSDAEREVVRRAVRGLVAVLEAPGAAVVEATIEYEQVDDDEL
jgi:hypothetical protein